MVVTQNFRSVDRLLAKPAAPSRTAVGQTGAGAARMFLLRHQVSEQNRWYFETWGLIESALGAPLLMVLIFGSTEKNFTLLLALLMLLIADRATVRFDAADGVPGTHHRLDSRGPAVARPLPLLDAAQRLCRPGNVELGVRLVSDRQAALPQPEARRRSGCRFAGGAQPRRAVNAAILRGPDPPGR